MEFLNYWNRGNINFLYLTIFCIDISVGELPLLLFAVAPAGHQKKALVELTVLGFGICINIPTRGV